HAEREGRLRRIAGRNDLRVGDAEVARGRIDVARTRVGDGAIDAEVHDRGACARAFAVAHRAVRVEVGATVCGIELRERVARDGPLEERSELVDIDLPRFEAERESRGSGVTREAFAA